MTTSYTFIIRLLCITILFFSGKIAAAQNEPLTFSNYGDSLVLGGATIYSDKIHQITINPDSTFKFWSMPLPASCFTWHEYQGTWRKEKDTFIFSNKYDVDEIDVRATYKKDATRSFLIHFKTDQNAKLTNRKIDIQYIYDFSEHIDDADTVLTISAHNTLTIPFKEIPYYRQLAAIRIEYLLNAKEKRTGYLTQNKTLNIKKSDIPNIISVEFVEKPKKEMVRLSTKAIIQNNTLVIISTNKTNTTLPDYKKDIEFENGYSLDK